MNYIVLKRYICEQKIICPYRIWFIWMFIPQNGFMYKAQKILIPNWYIYHSFEFFLSSLFNVTNNCRWSEGHWFDQVQVQLFVYSVSNIFPIMLFDLKTTSFSIFQRQIHIKMETLKNYLHQNVNYIPKARARKTNEFTWGNLHSD